MKKLNRQLSKDEDHEETQLSPKLEDSKRIVKVHTRTKSAGVPHSSDSATHSADSEEPQEPHLKSKRSLGSLTKKASKEKVSILEPEPGTETLSNSAKRKKGREALTKSLPSALTEHHLETTRKELLLTGKKSPTSQKPKEKEEVNKIVEEQPQPQQSPTPNLVFENTFLPRSLQEKKIFGVLFIEIRKTKISGMNFYLKKKHLFLFYLLFYFFLLFLFFIFSFLYFFLFLVLIFFRNFELFF